jgi:ABC-2 type transport system permease protein
VSDMFLVLQREFRERVGTKAFLLGTILFPVFVAATMILPSLFDRSETRTLVVVNEAPSGIAERFAARLSAAPEDPKGNRYVVKQMVAGPLEGVRSQLNARVQAREIDGFVVLPPNVLETNQIRYRSRTIASPGMLRDLRVAASEAVQGERLRRAGLDVSAVAQLIQRVEVENARITATGEEKGDAQSTFFVAYILAFVIYFMVAVYGVSVMRSVLEEKTSRISEVLVSSIPAMHLMAGKILGVASAVILQVLIWSVLIGLLVTQSDLIAQRAGIPPEAFRAVSVEPGALALLLVFFILGFLLFAALFAALGAAVTTEQEGQSFQMVVMLPLFLPLMFLMPLTSEPLGSTATTLGLFPFTAPVAMPMRMASTAIPPLQIALSVTLLLATLFVMAWIAGKIYRIGILATGKRPTLRELGHWLRAA